MKRRIRETVHVGAPKPDRIKRDVAPVAPPTHPAKPEPVEAKVESVKVRKKAQKSTTEHESLLGEDKPEVKAPADKPKKRTRRK